MPIPKPNKKTLIQVLIGALGVALAAALIALGGLFFPEEEKVLAPPLRKPDEVEYKTFTVKKASIENTIVCQAYFYPEQQVDIAFSNREGFLKGIYVRAGQPVSAGQMLASLDTDALAHEIKRQQLALEEAEETHRKLQALAAPDIAMSRLDLDELKHDLEVKQALGEGVSQSDLRKMETTVKKQELAHQRLTQDYDFRTRAAARDIEKARLSLDELELELRKSVLRSPSSGRVVYLAPVNQGERIPPYKIIVSVADPSRLILRYTGDKYDKFRLGMKVKALWGGKTFSGEVVLTPQEVPAEDFEKMKDTVHVRVAGPAAGFKVDDSATIEATIERADNVLVIPRRLVHTYGGRAFVKVLEDGIVNERDVKTGIESNLDCEITSGLEPGLLVVE